MYAVPPACSSLFRRRSSSRRVTSIHAYKDPPSIRSVALAVGIVDITDITDAAIYDTSSRTRTPQLGEIVI